MKRIIAFVIATLAILTLTLYVGASEITTTETTTEEAFDVNKDVTVTAEEEKGIIDTIMNSTVWASIASFLVMASGVVVVICKKFGSITTLIKGKADTATILNGVEKAIGESYAEIKNQLESTQKDLAETKEDNKKLTAIICMYIANDTRYNPTAKAEIMKYTSGIKQMAGTVEEICNTAQRAIAEAEASEVKESTPALDAITSEVKSYTMSLD
jgi:hypothetical protein